MRPIGLLDVLESALLNLRCHSRTPATTLPTHEARQNNPKHTASRLTPVLSKVHA
jgi:hypothetical protein